METDMDIAKLMKSLENEDNDCLMNLNTNTIKQIKNDMLQKLNLPREELKKLHKSLNQYRYIDEIPDIKYGAYIRWINLNNPNKIKLTNGGLICDIKIVNDDVIIVCKNKSNKFFQFKLNECFVFQKLSDQEKVLLSALDYLNV
tara:strand:- start:13460 stop:13891 length:432 start_codon:yes stop_codon:yes gene_type:complete